MELRGRLVCVSSIESGDRAVRDGVGCARPFASEASTCGAAFAVCREREPAHSSARASPAAERTTCIVHSIMRASLPSGVDIECDSSRVLARNSTTQLIETALYATHCGLASATLAQKRLMASVGTNKVLPQQRGEAGCCAPRSLRRNARGDATIAAHRLSKVVDTRNQGSDHAHGQAARYEVAPSSMNAKELGAAGGADWNAPFPEDV